jgi:hypothetical protein
MVPSVKGFAMQPAVDRIHFLCESGAIKDLDEVERLRPADVELLEARPSTTLWYPIDTQDRFLKVISDVQGGGDERYIIEFGVETAARVLQMRSMATILSGARAFGNRSGAALVRMARLGFNFGEWKYEGSGLDDFRVVVSDAEPLPDTVRYNIEGFIQFLASETVRAEVVCESTRPTRDHLVFRGKPREPRS